MVREFVYSSQLSVPFPSGQQEIKFGIQLIKMCTKIFINLAHVDCENSRSWCRLHSKFKKEL